MMNAPSDRDRLLAVLAQAQNVSAALASTDSIDDMFVAFAKACLDQSVDSCAVYLGDAGGRRRRVAYAVAADVSVDEEPALRSSHRVPLVVLGQEVGSITFSSRQGAALEDPVERARLDDLAGRASGALHTAWLRRDVRAAEQMRDELFSIASHELRTPLSTILGWSKLLRDGGLTAERSAKGLEAIHRSALAQSQRIDELLDASRVIGGRLVLVLENASVAPIIEETLATFADAAAKKQVTLEFRGEPSVAQVDVARVRQLATNLVGNAIKFTSAGGTVAVSVTNERDCVVLTVSDTGVGIDPALLSTVFDRFRHADATTARHPGGMGLGLAIVRRIVEGHQGEVHAESAGTGKGATFTVSLPRESRVEAPATA